MSALEIIVKIEGKAERYRREMWGDIIAAAIFFIAGLVTSLLHMPALNIVFTSAWATAAGMALSKRRCWKDLAHIVWLYQMKLTLDGIWKRDVQ